MSETPETEQQSWCEAVIECVSDSAERERLIRMYDYDELVKACLALGTLALTAKHEYQRGKKLERQRDEAVACLRRLMKASEKYAKAQMTANVAVENYTDPRPDVNAFSVAMVALHDEEVAARAFLATLDRTEKT
jgi:Tfp pilus assembly protein PilE